MSLIKCACGPRSGKGQSLAGSIRQGAHLRAGARAGSSVSPCPALCGSNNRCSVNGVTEQELNPSLQWQRRERETQEAGAQSNGGNPGPNRSQRNTQWECSGREPRAWIPVLMLGGLAVQPGPVLAPLRDCFLTSKMMQHPPMMQHSPSNNSLGSSGQGRSENPDPEDSGKSGFRLGRQREPAPGHPLSLPTHTYTHNTGCSGGMWGSTSHLPQAAGQDVSVTDSRQQTHTTLCHAHFHGHTCCHHCSLLGCLSSEGVPGLRC